MVGERELAWRGCVWVWFGCKVYVTVRRRHHRKIRPSVIVASAVALSSSDLVLLLFFFLFLRLPSCSFFNGIIQRCTFARLDAKQRRRRYWGK